MNFLCSNKRQRTSAMRGAATQFLWKIRLVLTPAAALTKSWASGCNQDDWVRGRRQEVRRGRDERPYPSAAFIFWSVLPLSPGPVGSGSSEPFIQLLLRGPSRGGGGLLIGGGSRLSLWRICLCRCLSSWNKGVLLPDCTSQLKKREREKPTDRRPWTEFSSVRSNMWVKMPLDLREIYSELWKIKERSPSASQRTRKDLRRNSIKTFPELLHKPDLPWQQEQRRLRSGDKTNLASFRLWWCFITSIAAHTCVYIHTYCIYISVYL